MSDTPPPTTGKLPRPKLPPTDPPADVPPEGGPLGELAGYDSIGDDLFPIPEGALDDLPPSPPSAASSWLGRETLARDESDVIRGLTQQPPPPGSSNIFDTGPGGSSRFFTPTGGTEHLTEEQPRPSNDVLYADLAQPAEPGSEVFSGDDLFDRPSGVGTPPPADTPPPGPSAADGSGSGSGVGFHVTAADDGSNLFADPTAADLDLNSEDGAVPLGAEPHSDADLSRTGPGSSIFASGAVPQSSALDVDHIPIMASVDDGRFEDLPFDAPPPSGVGADIFGRGKAPRPSGLGAVAFELTPDAAADPDATERSGGTVDWDLPVSIPSGPGQSSQRSRGVSVDEVAALDPTVLTDRAANLKQTIRKRPAEATGRAPVPDLPTEPRRAGGWLGGGAAGLLTGAGATAAALYFGGFLGGEAPAPKSAPQPVAAAPVSAGVDPAQVEAVRKEAADERKRLNDQLAAATRKAEAYKAELDKSGATPSPDLVTTQKKLLDALAAADAAKKEAAAATGKLDGTSKALVEASVKRQAAEEAVATVVAALKANKLAGEADLPAAALAKLPAALQAATGSDAQKAAAVIAEANAKTDAVRAELAAARKATEGATAMATTAKDELTAAQAKTDERVKTAAAEATAKAGQELEAARGRESALVKQLADAKQATEQTRAALEAGFRRQLADARSGVVVPLTTAEVQARDAAAADLGRGMSAYAAGRTADALGALDAAVAANPADARAWYFLGLARRKAGDGFGAETAFRKGAELERKGRTVKREVNEALLNVQGAERDALRPFRQ